MDNRTNWRYDNASLDNERLSSWVSQTQTTAEAGTGARLFSMSWCWVLVDVVILLVIVLGNVLTILAVRLSRRLRKVVSNRLVASLALSDLVVGLSLFYHLFFFLNASLSNHKATCLLRFVLLACGCCASFLNLTGIAVDRYLSIVHPLKYTENLSERFVYASIGFNWLVALLIALGIAFWNNYEPANGCELITVIPKYFIAVVLAPFFMAVWLSIVLLYWRIWKEAENHAQRWKMTGRYNFDSSHWKSIQVVLLILGCFSICWLPYAILAVTQAINSKREPSAIVYRVMFSIAMSNSGINPIIYAWKNPSFRKAFHRLLRLRMPDHNDYNSSFKNYLRKQSELSRRDLELENAKNNGAIEGKAAVPVAPASDCSTVPNSPTTIQKLTESTVC